MKQGRGALDGNGARDFLNAIHLLELGLREKGGKVLVDGLQVVSVGLAFKRVKEACLGMDLQPEWRDSIKDFSTKYRQSDMSVTPKVCIMDLVVFGII